MDIQVFSETATVLGDPLLLTVTVLALLLLYFAVHKGYVKHKAILKHRAFLRAFLAIAVPALALTLLGTETLKLVFQVPRPCIPCPGAGCSIWCPFTFSFPSSHASGTAAIATALYLVWKRKWRVAVYAFPAVVCASRIALGVHTIQDVTAGFLFGVVVTVIVWKYGKAAYGRMRRVSSGVKRTA
jgi:membrane-associated phospholipid phosphatase